MRFLAKNRINQANIYQDIFSNGYKFLNTSFSAYYKKNGLDYSRLGLAIRKKHLKHAVNRNRIKRMLRESFRLNLPILTHWDIVITSRQTTVDSNKPRFRADLNTLWQKLASFSN